MASNNTRASSRHSSYADSGTSETVATGRLVNPRYACYWTDSCQGQHELDDCQDRRNQQRGKLGIYYSPNARYYLYTHDEVNNKSLESNPSGCTMIHLLIYKIEKDIPYLLFVTKFLKQKRQDYQEVTSRECLLAFPSSNPCKKREDQTQVALRALQTITNRQEILKDCQLRLKRFLFVDSISIYPFYLTTEEAKLLMRGFTPNEEVHSLHWFPLRDVLDRLPAWHNYLTKEGHGRELAQIRHDIHSGIKLKRDIDGKEFTIWSVVATILMCIRNFVSFNEFLSAP